MELWGRHFNIWRSEEASEGKWDQEIKVSHKLTEDTLSPVKK